MTLHPPPPPHCFSAVEKGAVGGRREGRASAPVSDVRAPRLSCPGKSLDEAAVVLSQDEAHQQHVGPTRPRKTARLGIHSSGDDTDVMSSFNFTRVFSLLLNQQIVLHSMHRYYPRFYVTQADSPYTICWAPFQTFSFPETTFTAVTAYQNPRVRACTADLYKTLTQLKCGYFQGFNVTQTHCTTNNLLLLI